MELRAGRPEVHLDRGGIEVAARGGEAAGLVDGDRGEVTVAALAQAEGDVEVDRDVRG